jgi:hypothetical protein
MLLRKPSGDAYKQASLCGHYEVVRVLLDAGALCERDTFQGERCSSGLCCKSHIHNTDQTI